MRGRWRRGRARGPRAFLGVALASTLLACTGDMPLDPVVEAAPGSDAPNLSGGELVDMGSCPAAPGGLINETYQVRVQTVSLHDDARDVDVPIDVYVPRVSNGLPPVFGQGPFPVIVFSDGGYGWDPRLYTAEQDPILPEFTAYWAAKGHVVLAPRHGLVERGTISVTQTDRTADVSFALDEARDLVRHVDSSVFLDTRYPVVAGFSMGAVTAALIGGMTLPDTTLGTRPDFSDQRFKSGILLTGVPSAIGGISWWHPDWSGLRLPLISLVGADDLDNEPGTVPEDFLDVVRLSPPGAKHGVMVAGAGHFLGAHPHLDAPGTLRASRFATALFLRSYATPPNERAVYTLSDSSFCGLVSPDIITVERHEISSPLTYHGRRPESGDPAPDS